MPKLIPWQNSVQNCGVVYLERDNTTRYNFSWKLRLLIAQNLFWVIGGAIIAQAHSRNSNGEVIQEVQLPLSVFGALRRVLHFTRWEMKYQNTNCQMGGRFGQVEQVSLSETKTNTLTALGLTAHMKTQKCGTSAWPEMSTSNILKTILCVTSRIAKRIPFQNF